MQKQIAVIPAYNEEKTIEKVVAAIPKNFFVLVVNDGSADSTPQILEKIGKKTKNFAVLSHEKNLGVGTALRTGFNYALENSFEKIFCLDADGQHPPEKLVEMSKALEGADAVFASRFLNNNLEMPFLRRVGNKLFTTLTNLLFSANYSDVTCGMRGFTRNALKKILPELTEKGYGSALEIAFACSRHNLRVKEVSNPAIYFEGEKRNSVIKLFWEISTTFARKLF